MGNLQIKCKSETSASHSSSYAADVFNVVIAEYEVWHLVSQTAAIVQTR